MSTKVSESDSRDKDQGDGAMAGAATMEQSMAGYRVDVEPERLTSLIQRSAALAMERRQPSGRKESAASRRRQDAYRKVFDETRELPVVRPDGTETTLGQLVSGLLESVPEGAMGTVTAETFQRVSPFAELGRVVVGRAKGSAKPPVPIRPMLIGWGGDGHDSKLITGTNQTFMDVSWSYWVVAPFAAGYRARTAVRAEGLDAARLYPDTAAAAEFCATELTEEDRNSIYGLIHAWSCQYALAAPSTPVIAHEIQTTVCNCRACRITPFAFDGKICERGFPERLHNRATLGCHRVEHGHD